MATERKQQQERRLVPVETPVQISPQTVPKPSSSTQSSVKLPATAEDVPVLVDAGTCETEMYLYRTGIVAEHRLTFETAPTHQFEISLYGLPMAIDIDTVCVFAGSIPCSVISVGGNRNGTSPDNFDAFFGEHVTVWPTNNDIEPIEGVLLARKGKTGILLSISCDAERSTRLVEMQKFAAIGLTRAKGVRLLSATAASRISRSMCVGFSSTVGEKEYSVRYATTAVTWSDVYELTVVDEAAKRVSPSIPTSPALFSGRLARRLTIRNNDEHAKFDVSGTQLPRIYSDSHGGGYSRPSMMANAESSASMSLMGAKSSSGAVEQERVSELVIVHVHNNLRINHGETTIVTAGGDVVEVTGEHRYWYSDGSAEYSGVGESGVPTNRETHVEGRIGFVSNRSDVILLSPSKSQPAPITTTVPQAAPAVGFMHTVMVARGRVTSIPSAKLQTKLTFDIGTSTDVVVVRCEVQKTMRDGKIMRIGDTSFEDENDTRQTTAQRLESMRPRSIVVDIIVKNTRPDDVRFEYRATPNSHWSLGLKKFSYVVLQENDDGTSSYKHVLDSGMTDVVETRGMMERRLMFVLPAARRVRCVTLYAAN
jgi:hypothetical protein